MFVLPKTLRDFVEKAHSGQMRRGGEEPYFEHVKRVALNVFDKTASLDAMALALLHDVVEDTKHTFEECNEYLATTEAKEALVLLTKREGEDNSVYMQRILESGNRMALIVKYYDALDNAMFTEAGRQFTIEVLKRDPDKESRKYKNRAKRCAEALGDEFINNQYFYLN